MSRFKQRNANDAPNIAYTWQGTVLTVDADLASARSWPRAPSRMRWVRSPRSGRSCPFSSAMPDVSAHSARICLMSPRTARIGNNPIAFAAPRPDGPPFVVDFAMSNVARGKIHVVVRDGLPIPAGWAIDAQGAPTTDPMAALAGSLLPAAGHKGLAPAMIVEVLAGALTGARPLLSEGGAPGRVGAFGSCSIRWRWPDKRPSARACAHGPLIIIDYSAAGAHGRIPGERAAELRAAAKLNGIEIEDALLALLVELGATAGAPFPPA